MTNIDPTAPVEERKNRKKRFLIWGSVLAIGALITTAAFTDAEWAWLSGAMDEGVPVGPPNVDPENPGQPDPNDPTDPGDGGEVITTNYNLQLARETEPGSGLAGEFADHESAGGALAFYMDGADQLVPGGPAAEGTYFVKNVSRNLESSLKFTVVGYNPNLESTAPEAHAVSEAMLQAMRFTITVDGTDVVADGLTIAQVNALPATTVLAIAGEEGDTAQVDVELTLDESAAEVGKADAGAFIRIDGTSVVPAPAP